MDIDIEETDLIGDFENETIINELETRLRLSCFDKDELRKIRNLQLGKGVDKLPSVTLLDQLKADLLEKLMDLPLGVLEMIYTKYSS